MISGKPNAQYVLDVLVKELNGIQKPDFLTDLKFAKQPTYPPRARRKIFEEEAPCILVWLDSIGQGTTQARRGEDRPEMLVYMVGIVKPDRGVQEALLALCEDVRRVMRSNGERTWPGEDGSTNTWGLFTQPATSKTFDLSLHGASRATAIGLFESFWNVSYRFPTATG